MAKPKRAYSDALIYRATELFLSKGVKVESVSDQLNREFEGELSTQRLTRQSIYQLVAEARDKDILRLIPRTKDEMESKFISKFSSYPFRREVNINPVRIVNAPPLSNDEATSAAAADLVVQLIRKLDADRRTSGWKTNGPIGLGIGPGRATQQFARVLGSIHSMDTSIPQIALFGISAGCVAKRPQYASTAFYSFFTRVTTCTGLFAQPLVRAKDFESLRKAPEVRQAFDEKQNIDIIVTSMGSFRTCKHSVFRKIMDPLPAEDKPKWLKDCVGDVQYRPFSKDGPLIENLNEYRLVTLFELEELVSLATTAGKYVVLIARHCSGCAADSSVKKAAKARAFSLLPILTSPNLHLFSHVVTDVPTATECLAN